MATWLERAREKISPRPVGGTAVDRGSNGGCRWRLRSASKSG